WNARTRVHEYGGGAWTARDDGTLVFAEFSDPRLYRLDPGSSEPAPLTPADPGMRFADLRLTGGEVVAVGGAHEGSELRRDLVAVAIDGSGIRSLVGGSRFLAHPRLSPDGSRLAWIAWDHPNMPWDGTELRVGELADGVVSSWRTVLGGPAESVLQPEWIDDESLYALTDRTGWWNLHRVSLGDHAATVTELAPADRDMGGPLWMLGTSWYLPVDDGRVLFTSTFGTDTLHLLDPSADAVSDIPLAL